MPPKTPKSSANKAEAQAAAAANKAEAQAAAAANVAEAAAADVGQRDQEEKEPDEEEETRSTVSALDSYSDSSSEVDPLRLQHLEAVIALGVSRGDAEALGTTPPSTTATASDFKITQSAPKHALDR